MSDNDLVVGETYSINHLREVFGPDAIFIGFDEEPEIDQERMTAALEKASTAFWASIAASYREVSTGDMDVFGVNLFEDAASEAVTSWLRNNLPRDD